MKKIILITLVILPFTIVKPSFAFEPLYHRIITTDALDQDGFDNQSIITVYDRNTWVDIDDPGVDEAHGDNDELADTSTRLRNFRGEIINDLASCKRDSALLKLGEALHTVQDIYSHTNAVDNNLLFEIQGENMLNMQDGTSVCSGEDGVFKPTGLVSGHFLLGPAIGGGIVTELAKLASCYGNGIYGVEEISPFYVAPIVQEGEDAVCCHYHLNKDQPTALNGGLSFIAQIFAVQGTTDYLNIIYDKIAEDDSDNLSYYKKMLRKSQIRRMYVIDTTGSMEQDIIKIKEKLTSYLDRLIQDGGTEAPALGLITFKDEEEDQIENDFICSKTKIETLKNKINNLSAYGGDDCPESSAKALFSALNYFSDGPFVRAPSTRRSIFVHTDAPSHNPSLFNFYTNMALDKHVTVNLMKTEGCEVDTRANKIGFTPAINQKNSKIYTKKQMLKFQKSSQEIYQDVAESTGGINFNVSKDELDKVIPITLFISETGVEVLYSQKIPVNSTTLTETLIKIDSSMSTGKTMIMVKTIDAAALPTITLSRPNGDIVLESDADITINNLSTIVTYTIDSPIQGEWKVSLSNGTSSYLVRTYAQTDFGIAGLSLLKEAPLNIRNVQFMPIEGNPIAGDELLLRLSLTQAPDTLTLKLLSENQIIIAEPVLTLVENSTKSYEATIVVPNENFNIKLEGMLNTSQFQREIALSLKPSKVKLSFDERLGFLSYELYGVQAQNKTFNIHIANKNNTATTYTLSVNSQQGHTVSIQEQVTIPAGQEVTLPVSVSISADAIVGSTDEIMIIAEDINNANNSNYKVARLIIRPETLFSNGFE